MVKSVKCVCEKSKKGIIVYRHGFLCFWISNMRYDFLFYP